MIRNYFKLMLRNIKENKVFSFLNILGLTSGLFCFLLIYLWISNENSIDKYHANIDQLYSVYVDEKFYSTPPLLHKELKLKIPDFERVVAMSNFTVNSTFAKNEKHLKQKGKYVSEDYFNMFSYNFIEGNPTTVLNAPNLVVISKEMAELFFEDSKSAIGQSLTFDNSKELKISAVFEPSSQNTSENSDFYLNYDVLFETNPWMNEWKNYSPYTFIQLTQGADLEKVTQKIKHFLKDYVKGVNNAELGLQPYGDKYLYSNLETGGGKIEYVRLFGIIAFLIILMSCINFMNLASAGSMKRAKEIGVRKVLGAGRESLIIQFLGESTLLALASLFFALIFIALGLPFFNQITDKNIDLTNLPLSTWLIILAITFFTGLLSGSYPAFMLSSFKAIDIFKKKIEISNTTKWIRKGLVVFQFTISVVFISSMIIISNQNDYAQNKDIGFDRENLLAVMLTGDLQNNYDVFKGQALQISGVNSITKSSHIPLGDYGITHEVIWDNRTDADNATLFTGMTGSLDFVKTYGLKLIMGRELIHNYPDNIEYLINETAMKSMKMENPIGERLSFWGNYGTIVGVVRDFHFSTLKDPIIPMIIRSEGYPYFDVSFVKLNPNKVKQTLADLEILHNNLNPEFPFEYRFIDQEYDNLYKSESVFYKLSKYFSILAILISCLGLFGLVIFTAKQKTKEIGIRKVLGASVFTIISLITRDFLKLIILGVLIGTPISWYFMDKWLTNYEYRIDMPWLVFGLTAALIIGIALFTVSYESIKAAIVNPVKSLRNE
ncbi:MAG: hypothetical protein COB01_07485 [Lutibacter sp.]|nr:MAG: hypothetical protein COB01_07485 [Lutibacter sp.]